MNLREAMARGDPEFPGGEAERRGWYAGYDAAVADNAERDRRMYAQGRRDVCEEYDIIDGVVGAPDGAVNRRNTATEEAAWLRKMSLAWFDTQAEAINDSGAVRDADIGIPAWSKLNIFCRNWIRATIREAQACALEGYAPATNRTMRVVRAAQEYFAEHQEDGEGVPQPQLREMLDALEAYEDKDHG